MEITVNCDGCPMEAALRDLRDQIAELKQEIEDLKRLQSPVYTYPYVEPATTDPYPWWELNKFTCEVQ